MTIKTSDELVQDALTYINKIRPDADVSSGTLLKDIVVDAPATVLGVAYEELNQIKKASSINYASELTESQVDDLAANWNLTRKEGNRATGIATFIIYQVTSTVRIDLGTSVSTLKDDSGKSYGFTTIEDNIEINLENKEQYWNNNTNRYELNVHIKADNIGTDSNVPAGSIRVVNGISGIDDVTNNTACAGGLDRETNADLIERIKNASQARLLGTIPGYKTLVDADNRVLDSNVVDTTTNGYIRNTYGNEVDIIVIGEDPTPSNLETVLFDNDIHILESQPVIANGDIRITGTYGGSTVEFIKGVDYILLKDMGENKGTVFAKDKIIWQSTGRNPDSGTNYTINYSYNSLIEDLQDYIDQPENRLVGSDVLIREAERVDVYIQFNNIYTYSGTSKLATQQAITNKVVEYINNLKLGDKLEQSDLIYFLRNELDIIDNIDLPFKQFNITGIPLESNNTITPGPNQYLRINENNITYSTIN